MCTKRIVNYISFYALSLLILSCGPTSPNEPGSRKGLKGEIQLSGAFALYPMVIRWAEEFRKVHPDVKIDISGGGAGKGMTDALAGVVDLGMISREVYKEEIEKGAYVFAVVKDAVVLTINAKNPEIERINTIGIKQEIAKKLWSNKINTWGEVFNTSNKLPVHVFTRSDACGAAETFASWLGYRQEDLDATAIFGDPGVASVVQKDKVGIGYNNIAYVYDQKTKEPFKGLAVAPIDFNNNGKIDPEEDNFKHLDDLISAIKDGTYPHPLARDLYLVSKGKPEKPEVIEFLRYILTKGQKYTEEMGFVGLTKENIKISKDKL